jgi:hypothetical protein
MKSILNLITIATFATLFVSCGGTVDITKTSSGYFDPTDPAKVQILKTTPDWKYTELGTVDVNGFKPGDTAKMHNAIRAKAAPLGASAVIITDESTYYQPYVGVVKTISGVAIRR